MIDGFKIEASAVYDDAALQATLGMSPESLGVARRSGKLRFTRKGRRVLYLGRWLLDWFEAEPASAKGVCHDE